MKNVYIVWSYIFIFLNLYFCEYITGKFISLAFYGRNFCYEHSFATETKISLISRRFGLVVIKRELYFVNCFLAYNDLLSKRTGEVRRDPVRDSLLTGRRCHCPIPLASRVSSSIATFIGSNWKNLKNIYFFAENGISS